MKSYRPMANRAFVKSDKDIYNKESAFYINSGGIFEPKSISKRLFPSNQNNLLPYETNMLLHKTEFMIIISDNMEFHITFKKQIIIV